MGVTGVYATLFKGNIKMSLSLASGTSFPLGQCIFETHGVCERNFFRLESRRKAIIKDTFQANQCLEGDNMML